MGSSHLWGNLTRQDSSGFVNAGWLVYAATDSGQAPDGAGTLRVRKCPGCGNVAVGGLEIAQDMEKCGNIWKHMETYGKMMMNGDDIHHETCFCCFF